MDFFRAQHDARRRTRWLVVLFLLSLICLLTMANVLLFFVAASAQEPLLYVGVSAAIIVIVLFSSLFKSISLRRGGEAVAHMLNARLLAAPSTPAEQRLLNIVEEMAIASGTPVPPVYVLEESAINAFAAGHSINDAVIGITRGAMNKLNRDELQGVIAHEFSHILHGDMRLNLRLIAWLHGIMVLGIMGHYVLRAASSSRSNKNNNAGIAVLGLGLIVLGASGNFFGGLIKAAVSRQREYLADASAVQYTRNPQGIAGALKRIAVDTSSPVLSNAAANQISHALFSEGVQLYFSSLFATHPPLDKRIRVLDPQWNGEYSSLTQTTAVPDSAFATPQAADAAAAPLALALAIARAGAPDEQDVSDARAIHRLIPPACADAARQPLAAAAMICLLMMRDELLQAGAGDRVTQILLTRLPANITAGLHSEISSRIPDIQGIDVIYRLPLVNICLGTLRQLSAAQYQSYRNVLQHIIATDPSPDLSSWVLFQLTTHHLDKVLGIASESRAATIAAQTTLVQSSQALEIFLSLLAHCGHRLPEEAESAFHAAATSLPMPDLKFMAADQLTLPGFQHATGPLKKLVDADKQKLLNAMSECIFFDKKLTAAEDGLMKMTAEMLNWPLPAKMLR